MKLRSAEEKIDCGSWTSHLSTENTILIPQELLDELGWKKGTHIHYSTDKGRLIIKKTASYKK